jgi:hypothetical protein
VPLFLFPTNTKALLESRNALVVLPVRDNPAVFRFKTGIILTFVDWQSGYRSFYFLPFLFLQLVQDSFLY